MKKRITALFLCIGLVFAGGVPAAASEDIVSISDPADSAEIMEVDQEELYTGSSDGTGPAPVIAEEWETDAVPGAFSAPEPDGSGNTGESIIIPETETDEISAELQDSENPGKPEETEAAEDHASEADAGSVPELTDQGEETQKEINIQKEDTQEDTGKENTQTEDTEQKAEDQESEEEPEEAVEAEPEEELEQAGSVTVSYRTHVQSVGWQGWKKNGTMSGTSGQAKRLEAIQIKVSGVRNLGIRYKTHIQSIGWESGWKADGKTSGTSGQAKRLEAIQIQLTGSAASKYDVWYCVHAQYFGWLDWARNGAQAGTAGYGFRLEGIMIRVLPKGSKAPARQGRTLSPFYSRTDGPAVNKSKTGVAYNTHVQTYGWQDYAYNGSTSGTSGQSKRLEGIHIMLLNPKYSGDIEYRTHVQSIGWQGWKKNGQMAGTSGQSKRLEAIQIRLTGQMANKYDVYYRVHAQHFGWMGWAKNGAQAGTAGYSYRLEAIQIRLVTRGGAAPGSTETPFREKKSGNRLFADILRQYENTYGKARYYTWENLYNGYEGYPHVEGVYFADLRDLNGDGQTEFLIGYSAESYHDWRLDVWTADGRRHSLGKPAVYYGVDGATLCFCKYGKNTYAVSGSFFQDSTPELYGFRNTGSLGLVKKGTVNLGGGEISVQQSFSFGMGRPQSVEEYYVYGLYNDGMNKLKSKMKETKKKLGL